jgi:hypothetical protein
MKPENTGHNVSRKFLFIIVCVLITATAVFVVFMQYKTIKLKLVTLSYIKQNVSVQSFSIRKKAPTEAVVIVMVENSGNRIIDSLPMAIEYYGKNDKFLSRDKVDALKFVGDILIPRRTKIFNIAVTCPKQTSTVKVRLKTGIF